MRRLQTFRLIALVFMLAMGRMSAWSDAVSPSSVSEDSEIGFQFSGSEESSSIKDLPWNNVDSQTRNIAINGYVFNFYNCAKKGTNNNLLVRGDGYYNGHFSFAMNGVVSSVKFEKETRKAAGTVTLTLSAADGKKVVKTQAVSGTGEFSFDIPESERLTNPTITVSADFQLTVSKLTVVKKGGQIAESDTWVRFKKLGSKDYFSTSLDDVPEVSLGQIIEMESNGKDGFNPISTPDNQYVVVYSVYNANNAGGKNGVTFTNVCDSKGNWKNGNDSYPNDATKYGDKAGQKINLVGYVYRKGVVMTNLVEGGSVDNEFTPGTTVAVEVKIYKLTPKHNSNGSSDMEAEIVNSFVKKFKVVSDNNKRPHWGTYQKDVDFEPGSLKAMDGLDKLDQYKEGMAIVGTSDKVKVITLNGTDSYYMIAKFSTNDRYDPQSLFNANNITPVVGSKSTTSTSVGARRLSVLQFTPDGIAGENVAESYYYFVKREQLYFKAVEKGTGNTSVELDKTAGAAGEGKSTIALTAYYKDGGNEVQVEDLSVLNLSQSNITVADPYVKVTGFSVEGNTAYIDVEGVSNGTTTVNFKSTKTSITDAGSKNYSDAAINVSVTVKGSGETTPPLVTPSTRSYASAFKASVKGNKGTHTYWILVDGSTSTGFSASTLAEGEPEKSLAEQIKDEATGVTHTQGIVKAGDFEGASSNDIEIAAKAGANYELYAVSEATTINATTQFSAVAHQSYTYMAEEAPTLTPGTAGAGNYYKFYDEISVEAKTTNVNSVVYYKFYEKEGDELTFSVDNGEITTNGTLYNEGEKIDISKSSVVYALAYNPATGAYSDVVTYRYVKNCDDLKEQPYFVIDGTKYYNGDIYSSDISAKQVTIEATYYDGDNGDVKTIGGTSVSWSTDKFHIFYTTDGTTPTEKSLPYKGPFTVANPELASKIIAGVFVDADKTMSELSTLNIFNANLAYWQTTEENCPGGVLKDRNVAIEKDGTTFVNVQFGGFDTDPAWKHYVSHEYATGDPIDHIGVYTIAQSDDTHEGTADVCDENGKLWNHSKANDNTDGFQTHKATFGLPSKGSFVKFEPKQSGKLIVWCCQEGALYYSNAIDNDLYSSSNFNDKFLRKRPAYFVDEAGKSYVPKEIESAGKLSSNWYNQWSESHWAKKGESQHGVEQKLYTQNQTSYIYNMFREVIDAKKAQANVTPIKDLVVFLNTDAHKNIAGFNVADNGKNEGETDYTADENVDGTGVCLPSASYMKYTFDVKAGKTYFFFGWMTKIGIRGFGFEPASDALSDDVVVNSGKPASGTNVDASGDSNANDFSGMKGNTYAKVTVKRAFKAGTWTTLVLPFSVNASQVQEVFGEGTQVLHYRTIADRTMYFFKHYHQMIVAGTPVLVKPTKDIVNPEFTNVTIESTAVTDKPCNDYNDASDTNCQMIGSYTMQQYNQGDYYISSNGTVKRLNVTNAQLPGTRAYIVGKDSDGLPATVGYMARTAYNNPTPTGMDDETTGIDIINVNENDDTNANHSDNDVYNLSGQQVRHNTGSLEGLSNGVYVSGGKKILKK